MDPHFVISKITINQSIAQLAGVGDKYFIGLSMRRSGIASAPAAWIALLHRPVGYLVRETQVPTRGRGVQYCPTSIAPICEHDGTGANAPTS